MKRNEQGQSRVDEGRRNTEIKRETEMRGSLGTQPSYGKDKVTPESAEDMNVPADNDEDEPRSSDR